MTGKPEGPATADSGRFDAPDSHGAMAAAQNGEPIHVAQVVTTLARGGAQATVIASTAGLPSSVTVTVLAGAEQTEEGTYWGARQLDGVRTVALPRLRRRVAPFDDLATLWALIRWLRSDRPDVVHTHSTKAGVIGRLAAAAVGIPNAHTVHGWGPLRSHRPSVRLLGWLIEAIIARLSTALVVVGRADLDFGLTRRIGRPSSYHLIRSGVELPSPTHVAEVRQRVRAELELGDRFVVGMVARFAPQKDHLTLLRAFAEADLPRSTLVLVGDGPLREEISDAAAELGIADQTVMLGMRPDAADLVAGFDLAVLSTRFEGMPRTVVEAAAADVPIVATDVGSVSDLIAHEVSGLLVDPDDIAGLAEAMGRSHRDRAEAKTMAGVAAGRAAEFSADVMRRRLVTLWTQLAGRLEPTTNRSARDRTPPGTDRTDGTVRL